MTDTDRPAWVLWQIRALWRAVKQLIAQVVDLERSQVDLSRRVEQLENPDEETS